MLFFQETQQSVRELLLESREYATLQKRLMQLELSERLTALLSAVAIAAAIILLVSAALFFLLFALAHYIGQIKGDTTIGFVAVGALLLLILLVVYVFRYRLIVLPVTRLVNKTITDPEETSTKEEIQQKITESKDRMSHQIKAITQETIEPVSKAEAITQWVGRGYALYKGLKLGMGLMGAVQSLFGRKKRK